MGLNRKEQKFCEVTREKEKELKLKEKTGEKKVCRLRHFSVPVPILPRR